MESECPTTSTAVSSTDPIENRTQSAIAMLVQITTDGIPKLHCPVCNAALISLKGYVKHVEKHEPPGGFRCRYCEARYCSEEELKRHRDEVHTTIACRICEGVTFTNESDYREHIRNVHNGVDRVMFKCGTCNAEYKTIEPFRRHMETQCGTIKPHKCDQCSMAFVTKYNLKQHKETHTGERKFCCSYCGKDFLQKGRLVEHERSHTGEKPYKCDVCGKCFAHRESIVTHSSIHTGVRLVECKCCHSRFSCYSNLIKHRRTRPDTCGLPEYNPQKNRVRSHRSRIPPTLNPTSEIKVSNLNKIIKPQEQLKLHQSKATARKRTGQGPSTPLKNLTKRRRKKPETESEAEHTNTSDDADSENESSYSPQTKTRDTRRSLGQPKEQHNGYAKIEAELKHSDSDEDVGHFSEFEPEDFKLPLPILPSLKKEDKLDDNDFEYSDVNQFIDATLYVKSEVDANIFNEQDNLLDCLLNSEEHVNATPASGDHTTSPLSFQCVKIEENSLEEPEMVLCKGENGTVMTEEDVLSVSNLGEKKLNNCQIVLEDVTRRYPKLKEAHTVRVGRNLAPFFRLSKKQEHDIDRVERTVRKYRKRQEMTKKIITDRTPKRMARISQQELKARMKMLKKEEKSWQCPHCIKIYHMRKPFEKHLRNDHKRAEEEIKKLAGSNELGVSNEEVFKCHICDKIYLVEKRLLSHLKLHGPDGNLIFKCPCYCSVYFATKEEATAHAQTEHRDMLYCDICDKFMTGYDSLKKHMSNHHKGEKEPPRNMKRNFVCDKCGKKFSGRTSLTDHVRSDCGRMPLYPCTICGKHLTTAGILKTHLLLHKNETPYQCDQCGKTFKVKAQYKTHIKTRHTDYKAFKCHLCPKEYPYRESLLTHMTVHTGIKRFLCNGCGKRFTCISNLQAHRKVHAETCGLLPLNARATQYMGVQKGNLLLGAKPEAGLAYNETNTLIAREVIDRDLPMAQELNYPSEASEPLATVPLNYSQPMGMPQMVQQLYEPYA